VPKGKSTLLLKFQPSDVYYLGLAITSVTILLMALYYLLLVNPRTQRKIPEVQFQER